MMIRNVFKNPHICFYFLKFSFHDNLYSANYLEVGRIVSIKSTKSTYYV